MLSGASVKLPPLKQCFTASISFSNALNISELLLLLLLPKDAARYLERKGGEEHRRKKQAIRGILLLKDAVSICGKGNKYLDRKEGEEHRRKKQAVRDILLLLKRKGRRRCWIYAGS